MAQELINMTPDIPQSTAMLLQNHQASFSNLCNASNSCNNIVSKNSQINADKHKKESVKKKWSLEEDIKLMELVYQYGDNAWHRIYKEIPNKTEIKCFKRWKYL